MTHYENYLRMLIELHYLIQDGKGDDEESDDLRDKMDGPWYHLTRAEQKQLERISAALYRLGNIPSLTYENIGKYMVLL